MYVCVILCFRRFSQDKVVETHNEEKGGQTKKYACSFFVWEETRKIKNSFGNLQANLNLGVTTSKLGIMIGKRRR